MLGSTRNSIFFFLLSIIVAQLAVVSPALAEQVEISARVPGCGDGVVEALYGEQCDGVNLDNQSCQGLGYATGALSCSSSCAFVVSACSGGSSAGGSSSSGGFYSGGSNLTQQWGAARPAESVEQLFAKILARDGFVVFTGRGRPGSWVSVYNRNRHLSSTQVDSKGNFMTTSPSPKSGEYYFAVFSVDNKGDVLDRISVSTFISQELVTEISNISFDYSRPYRRPQGEVIGKPFIPVDIVPQIRDISPLPSPAAIFRQGSVVETNSVAAVVTPQPVANVESIIAVPQPDQDATYPAEKETESVVRIDTTRQKPDTEVVAQHDTGESPRSQTNVVKLWRQFVGWARSVVSRYFR